jgi:septal ring factor EnvC (AmiA/AmiB activator)
MKRYFTWTLMGAAFLGLGIAMPSCPGQQAMQQQLDALQNANMDLSKKVQALTTQNHTMSNDINQMKTLLPQMTNVISSQKIALDKLDADLKALQARIPNKGGKRR